MKPDRSRSWSAVERERQRTTAAISGIIERVSHKENPRFGFTVTVLDRHHADSGGVPEGLTASSDLVMSDDGRLLWGWGCLLLWSSLCGRMRTRSGQRGCWLWHMHVQIHSSRMTVVILMTSLI